MLKHELRGPVVLIFGVDEVLDMRRTQSPRCRLTCSPLTGQLAWHSSTNKLYGTLCRTLEALACCTEDVHYQHVRQYGMQDRRRANSSK